MKIVRTPTRVAGGITAEEKRRLDAHAQKWIANAMSTEPVDPDKITEAIEGLYRVSGLAKPVVVVVPSPLVMAFAYGAAATILDSYSATYSATDIATYSATASATYSATYSATDIATYSATASATYSATASATYRATDSATDSATASATYRATDSATDIATDSATASATYRKDHEAARACLDLAGEAGLARARRWQSTYQGGNMWSAYDCYLTAMRDVLGLRLPEHEAYHWWEQAALHGGFRVMHEKFCFVCDRPKTLLVDENNEPHCADGPSHEWRDGWRLYHWHGVRVPDHWIERKHELTPGEVLKESNLEVRRAGVEILGGWGAMLPALDGKVIEADPDPEIGTVIEVRLPDLSEPERFLRVQCATGREFALCLPKAVRKIDSYSLPHCAQAALVGLHPAEWRKPSITA